MAQEMPLGLRRQIRLGTLLWQAFGARRGWRSYWLDVAFGVLKGQPVQAQAPTPKEEEEGDEIGFVWTSFTL